MADHLKLPDDLREKAVDHLRKELHPDTLQEVRDIYKAEGEDWYVRYHFFFGMEVRNLLRGVIKDSALPPVDYGDNQWYQNWDDYYVRVIEEAAGIYDEQGA